jgi:ABC-type antimicrobial peptide transport system permease subunit
MVGGYGVASHSVALRAREIAIRRALGAIRFRILRMVGGQTATPVPTGLAIGALAAAAPTTLRCGVGRLDPPSFAGAALIMLLAPVVAAPITAARTIHVDPMAALRVG